jgi:hypothetical protein
MKSGQKNCAIIATHPKLRISLRRFTKVVTAETMSP